MKTKDFLVREEGTSSEYLSAVQESASSGNAEKILLSTLWNQSGTIYVNSGGEQTALSGYTYNKYCPVDPDTNVRSVTGCSNTADSQVLYYWIEKGKSFNLRVSAEDFFDLQSDSNTYHVSNVSQVGEGTIQQVNGALSAANPVGNGDFIAALNFYCGVKNHSGYSSRATGTNWWVASYYDGTNAAAYVDAGFDSYFCIARDWDWSYSSVGSTFFDKTSGLTDVGFSVLRENLDYGEVIRVGIPGHAIVMDGYRYNSTSKEYEYHLNYGWGTYSSATRWYTVSELNDTSEAYVNYVMVDLSPNITVTVSNNRGDYYGGSFLRGLERINHIVSGKDKTTFTFDSSLAGKSISLSTSANLTSGVGVNFTNLCVALSTTASALFSSGAMMSFSLKNGSMAVNSTSANYVVQETGSAAVSLSLNSSYVYSGYYSSGVSKLDALLKNDSVYAYSNYADDFYRTVSGYAVIGGSAADTVTLSNGSAIFGNLDLGSGANKLNIENGSLYYGSFTGAAATLNVNLSIKSSAQRGPMIVLRDSASDANFYSASSGRLNLSLSSLSAGSYTFSLYSGHDAEKVKDYSVKVAYNGASYLLNYNNRSAGMFSLNYSGADLKLSYTNGLTAPSVQASTTAITNKNVTLTATFSADSAQKQYSTDNKTWKTYTSAISVASNATYYFRGINAAGDISPVTTYKVTNIDKTAPAKPTVTASTTAATNKNVTLTAAFSADSVKKQYSTDNKTWKAYTSAVSVASNATYYFRGIDAVGNISAVTSYKVSNIDKTAPAKPTIVSVSTTAMTNKNVTLTVSYSTDSAKKQYSTDNKTWKTYSSAVSVASNGTYYFRGVDAAGNASAVTSYKVSNIDKTAPSKPTVKASTTAVTNKNVTLTAAFSADSAKKQYSTDNKTWKTYSSAVSVASNATYYFRGIDAVGNISAVTSYKVSNIDRTLPSIASISTTAMTNKNVVVKASYSADTVKKQYSLNNLSWMAYPASGVTMKQNGTVYFRGINKAGRITPVASYKVSNIDTVAPAKPTVKASTTAATNKNVKLTATYSADTKTKQYSTDNRTWKAYSSAVSAANNGTYYFRGIDAAGNASAVTSFKVSNIDKVAPAKPTVKANTTVVTNQNVKLTATYSSDTKTKQYSTDNKTWKTYSSAVSAASNGTYYFRGLDAAGNASAVTSYKVSNIDKVAPAKPTIVSVSTTAMTNKNVTIKANFSSDSAKKQYSTDNKTWKTYSSAVTLTQNGTVYFRGIDKAGNISGTTSKKVTNICPLGDFTNDTLKAAESKKALKLSTAQKISGWVGLGDAKDFIKLEVQKAGRVSLDMNSATAKARNAGQIQLSVLDKSGKSVAVSKLDNDTLATASKLAAGTYYLGVACTDVNKYSTSYTVTAGMLAS